MSGHPSVELRDALKGFAGDRSRRQRASRSIFTNWRLQVRLAEGERIGQSVNGRASGHPACFEGINEDTFAAVLAIAAPSVVSARRVSVHVGDDGFAIAVTIVESIAST
jgi:hypothetical protein